MGNTPHLRQQFVDLNNLDNSIAIHAPGQSGHFFHQHYTDMIDPWCKLEYHPMFWSQQTLTANTTDKLHLVPQKLRAKS
ncbi:putative penicillin amidase [Nostoc sp. NIES-3756]|uniref:penicillin acylase family protein n=1 Tax=Nostoc sp. NIES-3756 TaxID=1751286 RepID=UPI00071FC884|nr:penicillin acylase family protein [Nostoc sp. NIES-3756]BAT52999.1 putative penicillin amidase [Nostoc sp. NIES-3756]BAY39279.1 putative penicillin amidase [Nostoc sp. NIES-2111]